MIKDLGWTIEECIFNLSSIAKKFKDITITEIKLKPNYWEQLKEEKGCLLRLENNIITLVGPHNYIRVIK